MSVVTCLHHVHLFVVDSNQPSKTKNKLGNLYPIRTVEGGGGEGRGRQF